MPLSRLLLVRQSVPDRRIPDVTAEVHRQLAANAFGPDLAPGSRVAIGVGSRGIRNLPQIVRAVVEHWKNRGMQPFLFPAMGSHGAATAEGQAAVLAHFGITPETMGCPVVSRLDVVPLGATVEGVETFVDRTAYESDGIMLVARVKWHTDFSGALESGLFKMMAIGLGKFAGAQQYHAHAYKLGLERVIRSVGRKVLGTGKILGGLAILEDGHHNTAKLEAVPAQSLEQREEELLALVKTWMPRLPFDLDLLVVDEMGKNHSGAGMDTKVINRGVYGQSNAWPGIPRIERIFVRDLSAKSYGNAVGVGMADLMHGRMVNKIDWPATQVNSLTSNSLPCIRTPIHFDTDRECLERLARTVGKLQTEEVTTAWIRNTNEIALLALTENLRERVNAREDLEIVAGPFEWPFDETGNLPGLLPLD